MHSLAAMKATLLPPTETDFRMYAAGWMAEGKRTEMPGVLKAVFAVIGLFCTGYLLLYMSGAAQGSHPIPSTDLLARSGEWAMYAIAAVTFVYACVAAVGAFNKNEEE